MNGKDVFRGMQHIDTKWIEQAESGKFSQEAFYKDASTSKHSIRFSIMLAAAISLMLLLMGSGFYMLRMQNLKLGDQQVSEQRWDAENQTVVTETVSQQVLTLSGLKGTPNYQAAEEWFAFLRDYDPDFAIRGSLTPEDLASVKQYASYGTCSQEMTGKLEEISKKYDLALLSSWANRNGRADVLEDFGLSGILLPDAHARIETLVSSATVEGYFEVHTQMNPMEGTEDWLYDPLVSYYFTPKGFFNPAMVELEDTGDWEEESYTTPSGYTLLILRSPSDWRSFVFCEREDATIYLRMETIFEMYGNNQITRQPMTEQQLHRILDAIDFSLTPQAYTPAT